MHMQKTAFQVNCVLHMTETRYQSQMIAHIGQKEFYLDQTFSTWVLSQAITHCMQEIVDNKAECNMV